MKTIVIAIGTKLIDNFRHLPASYIDEVEDTKVIIHYSPEISISRGKVVKNFDLLITDQTYDEEKLRLLHDREVVVLKRFRKSVQSILVNRIASDLKLWRHVPLITHCLYDVKESKNPFNFGSDLDTEGKYVLKTEHGARGIGQILFDIDKVSITDIMDAIYDTDNDAKIDDGALKGLIALGGKENDPGEGIAVLKSQPMILQQYVSNIEREFRIHVGSTTDQIYAMERNLVDRNGFKQATGADSGVVRDRLELFSNMGIHPDIYSDVVSLITKLMTSKDFIFGSMDLFLDDEGHWGIFEYSNQFGTVAYNPAVMLEFHKNAIRTWIMR